MHKDGKPDYFEGTTEQFWALASPVRNRVFRQMQVIRPCSVTDIANALGMRPTTVHYHVQYLVNVGLAKAVGKRSIGPRSETIFEASDKRFLLQVSEDPKLREVASKSTQAFLRATQRELQRAIAAPHTDRTHFARLTGRVTPELFEKICDLLWQAENQMKEDGDGSRYSLTVALVPLGR